MTFNIDDPDTWPDDPAELERLAADTGDSAEAEELTDQEATDDTADSADTEESSEETSEDATDAQESEEQTDEDKDEVTTIDGIPVITRDGKHVIPHNVLRTEREKRRAAEAELAKLREQSSSATSTTEDNTEPPTTSDEIPDSVKNRAEEIREQWGDHHAEQYLENYQLKQQIAKQTQVLEELRTARQRDTDRAQATEQQQQRDAIDNSPALAAWEADAENTPWFTRAVELNNMLVNIDDDYAAMSWNERFQVLPDKLKAMYPHAPMPQAPATKDEVAKKAKAALDEAESKAAGKPPASMTAMEGSDIGETKSPLRQVEDMTPAELDAYVAKLAEKGELDKFLRSIDSPQ